IFDFNFVGGSMGSVVGERLTRLFERAEAERLPVVVVSAGGGGARMQEGILSLMQMAKTSQAVARYRRCRMPFISVLPDPSMGGVVGEPLLRRFGRAGAERLPGVVVSGGGGGARMQEGILSLMQMAKTSQAVARYRRCRMPFISVLTDPTMGGVYASFASLG